MTGVAIEARLIAVFEDRGLLGADRGPVLDWTRTVDQAGGRDVGVIVTVDGRIVAQTRRQGRSAEAWGVVLEGSDVLLPLRHAMPGLSYALGIEVVHIRGWEVCA